MKKSNTLIFSIFILSFFIFISDQIKAQTADAGPDQDICEGESVEIGGSPTGDCSATSPSYSWSPQTGLSDPTDPNPTASPTVTTTYTVTVDCSIEGTVTDDVTVVVSNLQADAGPDIDTCENATVQIGGSPTASDGMGAYTYSWQPAGILDDATVSNPNATPSSFSTKLFVTVTDSFGCMRTDSMVITAHPLPQAEAGDDQTICAGDTVTLGDPDPTGFDYSWSPAASLDNSSVRQPSAFPAATTTYTVTVTDVNNCSNTDQVTLSVYDVSANAGTDKNICANDTVEIGGAPTATSGQEPYSYFWSPGATLDDSTLANPKAFPPDTTTYEVTVVDACSDTTTDNMTVYTDPAPVADAGPDKQVCIGSQVQIGGSPTASGIGPFTYDWLPDGSLSDPSAANPDASPETNTTYTVTITDKCNTNATDQVTVTVNDLPVADAGVPDSICLGDTTVIGEPASGGTSPYTYQWQGDSLDDKTAISPKAFPITTTDFIVEVTDDNGCVDHDTVTVTVYNLIAEAGTGFVCIGDSTQRDSTQIGGAPTAFGGKAPITYSWTPTDSLDDPTIANPIAFPDTTTTYHVEVTDACSDVRNDSVTVFVYPITIADAGADQSICEGDSVTIGGAPTATTGTTPFSYSWAPAATLDDDTIANPLAFPDATTAYTVTVTDSNSCTDQASVTVMVDPDPIVDAGPNKSVCIGSQVQIGGSPTATGVEPFTYDWFPDGSLSDHTVANPDASPETNTTYTVSVTDKCNATASDQVDVTVNDLPVADAGVPDSICLGDTTVIGEPASGGTSPYTYQWQGDSLDDKTAVSPKAFPITTTDFIVEVTDDNGCVDHDTVEVVVYDMILDAGEDTAICPGDTIQIGRDTIVTGGQAPYTYSWNPTTGLDDPSIPNPRAFPTSTTKYFITVTDACSDSKEDSVTVTVHPDMIADAGPNRFLCKGDSVMIGGSPTAASGTPPFIYSWTNGSKLDNDTIANPMAFPQFTTSFTVTITDTFGCVDDDDMIVSVGSNPTAEAGPDSLICVGDTVVIGGNPTASGGAPGYTYSWSPADSLDDPTSENPQAFPSEATTYIVTVTDDNGCKDKDTVTLTLSSLSAEAGEDIFICEGDTTVIGPDSTATGGRPPYAYLWNPTDSLDDPTLANPSAFPVITSVYTVTVTDDKGCQRSDSMTVHVDVQPVADAGNDATICAEDTIEIGGNPTASNGKAPFMYEWTPLQSLNDTTIANPRAYPDDTTTYVLTVTDACEQTNQDDVTIHVNPLPVADAGSDTSLCPGDTTLLGGSPTASAGTPPYTYQWDPATGLDDETAENPAAFPDSTTIYALQLTDDKGCTHNDTVTVTIYDIIANAGTDAVICEGDSTQLGGAPTAMGGKEPFTYSWTPTDNLDDPATANPTAFPAATTTYHLEVTDACAEVGNDSVTVVVNPNPIADAGADQAICDGESTTIGGTPTATGGTSPLSISWAPAATLDDDTLANPVATPDTTTEYTVTVTDSNSCTDQASVTVTVNPNPIADAGADQVICEGESATIGGAPTASDGTTPFSYSWAPAATLDDDTLANPAASPDTTTEYTVRVTDSNSCTDQASVTVTVNPNPIADAGTNQVICEGDSVTIGGAPTASDGTAPYTYSWTPAASLDDDTLENPVASPTTTTTYTVTVTDNNSCTDQASATVTVNPVPIVDAGTDQAICEGASATLGGSPTASGGTSPYNYSWTPAASLDDDTLANPTASPDTTTEYTVMVSDDNNCTDQASVTVTVNPNPIADAGTNDTICEGATATIGGAPTATDGTAPYSYTWTPGASLDDDTLANPVASPNTTTTYTVDVTDNNGCTDQASVTVTVNPVPVVDAGANQAICEDESVTIGGMPTASGGTSPYAYSWTPGASLDDDTLANPVASPNTTTTYTVTVTDINSCTDQASVTVTVNPNPIADAGTDSTICEGSSVTLGGAPTASDGTAPYSYSWTPAATLNDDTIANPTASPTDTTDYIVWVNDAEGCAANDTVTVAVINEVPVADFDFNEACLGAATNFENLSIVSSGTLSYEWAFGDGDTSILEDPSHTYAASDTYDVILIARSDQGCQDTTVKAVAVHPLPTAGFTYTQSAQTLSFDPAVSGLSAYEWDFGDDNTSTDENPEHTYTSGGTFIITLTVTDDNGCQNTSTDSVTNVSVENIPTTNLHLIAYPNPYRGETVIRYDLEKLAKVEIRVYNTNGKQVSVLTEQVTQSPGTYQYTFSGKAEGHAPGAYFVRVIVDGQVHTLKLMEMD